ncbi:UNVERIFIED_ORG: transcriptional regulator [Pseudomonas psychrophila]
MKNSLTTLLINRASTNFVPNPNPPFSNYSPPSQVWLFNHSKRELCNEIDRIQLTPIESLLIKTLTMSSERICSKYELITSIDKDPNNYSGLEMCLSRLQNKFRATFNERLFRSVRNRGYCLVQDINIFIDTKPN